MRQFRDADRDAPLIPLPVPDRAIVRPTAVADWRDRFGADALGEDPTQI